MAQLREYLHTVEQAPLMDAGVEVVDLRDYLAKIDGKFKTQREAVTFNILDTKFDIILGMSWLQSEDHPVNFYRRTVHIRDRNGVLVSCTVPPPHPSISYHVVSAASIRASITRDDVEEMGLCFLHALPPYDNPSTNASTDSRITELSNAYGNVFEAPHGVVPDRPIRHEIIIEARAVPPRGCIYCMSEEELSVLRAQLDDLLEKGWIWPSSSHYGAPVLFVLKKNKDLLCIDYRKLNTQTVKNVGPLPHIEDLLEWLGGAKFFSKLDLKSGYHQLKIRWEDRYKTAFKTRYGHIEWLVMPFGLTNAPTMFQATMTTKFRHMLDRFVLIYLDDILLYIRSLDEHVDHLRTVSERLRQAKYKANRDKCEFARQELEYLGHYVTLQSIRPLADKIEVIRHPVEYFNHKVPPINSLDDARKKELLAFVMAFKRWQHFLLGRRKFTWVTDNNPLIYYKTQNTVSSTVKRWMYFIDHSDFTSKHLAGLSNRAADALSRRPDLCAMTHHAFAFDEELQRHFIRAYKSDPDFATLYAQLSSDHPSTNHYHIVDGYLLLHSRGKDLLCVPRDCCLWTCLSASTTTRNSPATSESTERLQDFGNDSGGPTSLSTSLDIAILAKSADEASPTIAIPTVNCARCPSRGNPASSLQWTSPTHSPATTSGTTTSSRSLTD
ncbi:hypothetical protein CBR_g23263 [Chara braunii]|uniref:RNA-directed DNA polymerase n=1 Tax=Chara braunii TaxID=69332 RepID=A0A388JVA1_CHABU|nr:hypothetical protein CBR_g23263 [Chara braunii]|eukprot:GBG61749.1 hypothetical protein CBR_g23263 [Chara braunii]